MNERFLLYIDLLGFSDLVHAKPTAISDIFDALDRSQAHSHGDFEVIQFSDTLLVFNNKNPANDYDKHYFTMYLCEFAQELQYMLLSRDTFFRGLVTCGQFEDTGSSPNSYTHIRAFWGKGLIHAYRTTNSIQAIGLFVDDHIKPHMRVFPTHPYDDRNHVWFVDTTSVSRQEFGYMTSKHDIPNAMNYVRLCGLEQLLAYDLLFLRRLFEFSHNNTLAPRVRTKYLTTWEMYRQEYSILCQAIEDAEFDFKRLFSYDWEPMIAAIKERRGFFG